MSWRRSSRTIVAAVVVGGAISMGSAIASAPPASAADRPDERVDGSSAVASLREVTPNALRPTDDALTLAGTVTNNGDEVLENVQVLPRYSKDSLDSRDDIRRVPTDLEVRKGKRYPEPFVIVADALAPGATVDFSLSIPVESLGFTNAGVYVVGVDVRGRPPEESRIDLDTRRTVVPWIPDDEPLPQVPVSLLWPVTAQPTMLPGGTLVDDSLAARLAPGGALDAVVDAAADSPAAAVSWMVDPELLATVDEMADGYRVRAGAVETDGAGADAAARWLDRFTDTTRDADVTLLPFARPDLDALAAVDPDLADAYADDAVEATRAVASDLELRGRTDLAWPDGSGTSQDGLDALAGAGLRTIVLPAQGVDRPDDATNSWLDAIGGDVQAFVADTGLDSALTDAALAADPQAGALDLQQRWLAETAMVAIDAAEDDEPPPALVGAPPQRWSPAAATADAAIRAMTSAPWIAPTAIGDRNPMGDPEPISLREPADTEALPAANAEATRTLGEAARHYATMLTDGAAMGDALTGTALRSSSTAWRDDPSAGESYTSTVTSALDAQIRKVSVTVPETVTLSSRRGVFPLTVTNDLDQAVVVRLAITSDNVDRLQVDEVGVQTVEAGEKASITVTAQASTNGKVPIEIQLVSGDGAPLGRPHHTIVNATDYGTLGWVIVAAAAALFGAALVRRMIRGRSSGREAGATTSPLDQTDHADHPTPAAGDEPADPGTDEPAARVAP